VEKEEFIEIVGERVDSLVNLDVASRNAIRILYPLARKKSERPLCLSATSLLQERVHYRDVVFIATGFPCRPHISHAIFESDGPPGAAALARALHIGFGATPIILTEEGAVESMSRVIQAAGFRILSPEEAIATVGHFAIIRGAAVLGFPADDAEAKERAKELISKYKPAGIVVIEKAGMNEKGVIHGSRGDRNDAMAKIDYLVLEAMEKNIVTIGIGDGGNELGMGVIQEELKKSSIPNMAKCQCGCGGGGAPATRTDVLITATVSNWGAYGIAACLAFLLQRPEVFHDAMMEERILEATANANLLDGGTGYCLPGADGLSSVVHQAVITLLGQIVLQGIRVMQKGDARPGGDKDYRA